MVTISHIVENIIKRRPLLQEAILNNIVSYAALAEQLSPEIEKELNKKINHSAVVMAVRRNSEKIINSFKKKKFDYNAEIIMKSNLFDVSVAKSSNLLKNLKDIYNIVNYEKGDTLNIIHGNYEISIIISSRYKDKLMNILKNEKIINKEENLCSLTLNFSEDYFDTPGVISEITRRLAWENINLIEIVSTYTELTFIISKKEVNLAYNSLQNLIDEKGL